MGNYDQMAAAVSELSGGKNVVLLDDVGKPSIYVRIPKGKNSELVTGLSDNVHLAFNVNSVEKTAFYYSKYQNIIENGRAYSLAHRDPKVSLNWDAARQACEAKGSGFHLATLAEWAYIALWSRKNGTMPHGNNNYGKDSAYTYEKGEEAAKDGSNTGRCFTGSGPVTWNHNWQSDGICDLNGNVWEWNAGMRLVDGEIQIIPYNNAAMGAECDMSATSTLWKAIKADGSLVDPGTSGTLKWDWVSNQIQLTSGAITSTADSGHGAEYKNMTLASGLTAPEIAKILLLYPDEPGGDYGGDYHYFNPAGERLPVCGGGWNAGASAGVFYVSLTHPRSYAYGTIGFRSAFVDL
jgi:hypothetical protein